MIELRNDALIFNFPEVHPKARLRVSFQRTLRIPDDGRDYPLPPGLGCFPLKHVDDHAKTVPASWLRHGGVMLPMYQSEAMWLNFDSDYVNGHGVPWPFAMKIATGKVSAVTGEAWTEDLKAGGRQDYVVVPEQPWLDGYVVERGLIRQFVAMPLGAGYSAEEQITGAGEVGGIQILVRPMRREAFEKRFPKRRRMEMGMPCCPPAFAVADEEAAYDMGLAPGGRMRQEIYDDPYDPGDWDLARSSRCFVHIANSLVWRAIAGSEPPTAPLTASEYTDAGLPWFEYYDDKHQVLSSAPALEKLRSVSEIGKDRGDVPLPENETVDPLNIVDIRANLRPGQVREGTF